MSPVIVLAALVLAAPVSAPSADEAGIRKALEHYLVGQATGSAEELRQAFHPDARLFWSVDGKVQQRSAADFIASATGRPASDEHLRRRRIASIDITGNAAVAQIVLEYPRAKYTDYMSLVRTGSHWTIVNKTYDVQRLPPQ